MNGATGECAAATTNSIREQILALEALPETPFLLGVGGPDLDTSRRLLRLAAEHGARAALVPVPYFFRYGSEEAVAFVRSLAAEASLPLLLYNLPQFTSGYEPEAVMALSSTAHGIKDSSGSLILLRSLRETKPSFFRILGHDGALVEAVAEGLLDGVISGVAGVAPELTVAVWRGNPVANELLAELLQKLEGVPTPWGLKWIAETRGWFPARHALPLSAARMAQKAEFQAWCAAWVKKIEKLVD